MLQAPIQCSLQWYPGWESLHYVIYYAQNVTLYSWKIDYQGSSVMKKVTILIDMPHTVTIARYLNIMLATILVTRWWEIRSQSSTRGPWRQTSDVSVGHPHMHISPSRLLEDHSFISTTLHSPVKSLQWFVLCVVEHCYLAEWH